MTAYSRFKVQSSLFKEKIDRGTLQLKNDFASLIQIPSGSVSVWILVKSGQRRDKLGESKL
jgi:hypothetical protein